MLCGRLVIARFELGPQPVSNKFATQAGNAALKVNLALGGCDGCGLVQLVPPITHTKLVPPFPLVYREPEAHLDEVVSRCLRLPGIGAQSVVAGVTYKDDSTLERFARAGLSHWTIDRRVDLGVNDPAANIETVQNVLTPDVAHQIRARQGGADILVARHIVEHCGNIATFINALRVLVNDNGYLVLEVPDCRPNLQRRDYTMIWEEHSAYFTPSSFAALPSLSGFQPVWQDVFPLIYEPCLVHVMQKNENDGSAGQVTFPTAADEGRQSLKDYADGFRERTRSLKTFLAQVRDRTGKAPVIYGAGHLSSAFVTYHDLSDFLAYVVDDTPSKQGHFMPAGDLEIRPSTCLIEDGVDLVLLGVSPEIEDAVIAKNASYVARGGEFYSILCSSPRSIVPML